MIPALSIPFGGPPVVVSSISKELSKRHEVTVYTTSAIDQRKDFTRQRHETHVDNYRIVYFPRIFTFTGFNISPLMRNELAKTINHFDVVHLHAYRHFQDLIVCHYSKEFNVPYTLQVHAALSKTSKPLRKRFYDTLFTHNVLKEASRVIAISEAEVEQYQAEGVPLSRISLIQNGIDLSKYEILPYKGSFKLKHKITPSSKLILYLGRVHEAKGIAFLIKAFALFVRNCSDEVFLVVAGPDDGYLNSAVQLAMSLKILSRCIFTGLLSENEKISAFVDADVVVNVEPANVFGLVPLEAAACSVPVIVCKSNSISKFVNDGAFGYTVRFGDEHELADCIVKILDKNTLSRKMGQNGRQYIFQHFNWAQIVTRLEKLYEEQIIDYGRGSL